MSGLANESSMGQMEALLASGLNALSRNQEITFQLYQKYVMAQDGYVFWVATGNPFVATGSLHFSTDRVQEEDQTIGVNTIIFTSEEEVTQFNLVNPQLMYIATWTPSGQFPVQIAFSKRGAYYRQADIWHYSGIAVYPALSSQIVNSAADLPVGPIVSDSLPVWLSMSSVGAVTYPVYPSFLVPDNVLPPYIVVHIEPKDTVAVQSFPLFQWPGEPNPPTNLQNMTSQQLAKDHVRLTLYGFNNQQVIQYIAMIMDASLNMEEFGFMSDLISRDEKRTQTEIAVIAMKKMIEMDVSYYQSTADAIARRLILSSLVTYETI